MNVRIMRVRVHERFMPVRMCMWLARWVAGRVRMLMVRIVPVKVLVFRRLMPVFVLMLFRQVQPHARPHEYRRNPEP